MWAFTTYYYYYAFYIEVMPLGRTDTMIHRISQMNDMVVCLTEQPDFKIILGIYNIKQIFLNKTKNNLEYIKRLDRKHRCVPVVI